MCRTATAALVAAAPKPSEPGDSGNSKEKKDDDLKKDKKYPHDRDAPSRIGSHLPSRGNNQETRNKYPEDKTQNRGIDAPRQTHTERDRQAMPPPKGPADKTGNGAYLVSS